MKKNHVVILALATFALGIVVGLLGIGGFLSAGLVRRAEAARAEAEAARAQALEARDTVGASLLIP